MAGYICTGHCSGTAFAFAILMLAGPINATGRSFQMPTVSSLISQFSDPREQGVVFGLYSGLSSLARIVGPVIAGIAYPFLNNTAQFAVAGIITLLMAFWLIKLRQSVPAEPIPAPIQTGE
jgi:MFS family permease